MCMYELAYGAVPGAGATRAPSKEPSPSARGSLPLPGLGQPLIKPAIPFGAHLFQIEPFISAPAAAGGETGVVEQFQKSDDGLVVRLSAEIPHNYPDAVIQERPVRIADARIRNHGYAGRQIFWDFRRRRSDLGEGRLDKRQPDLRAAQISGYLRRRNRPDPAISLSQPETT